MGFYEDWNAGGPIQELVERWFAADAEWHEDERLPDADRHRGRAEIASMLERLAEAAGRFQADPGEIRSAGDESLIALRLHGPSPSGFPIDYAVVHGHLATGGVLTRVRALGSMEEAPAGGPSPG